MPGITIDLDEGDAVVGVAVPFAETNTTPPPPPAGIDSVRFGWFVKCARERKGWNMTEFAKRLSDAGLTNFHASTIGRMERGERPVRLAEAATVCGLLGLDVAALS